MMVALAMSPPSQIVCKPYRPPRCSSAFTNVVMMRAPLAPSGCPIAIAPPLTLVLARSAPVSCAYASVGFMAHLANLPRGGLILAEALVMGKVLCVFPNSVGGHVETTDESGVHFGRGGGVAHVVGNFSGLAVVEFGDADVPIEASIAVIALPF